MSAWCRAMGWVQAIFTACMGARALDRGKSRTATELVDAYLVIP